ncbi:MAG: hypothetical protein LBF28_02730, partial [Rickettsiales bacterium]|nr:hypothetical protein [Rickettsiales bacterium]
MKKKPEVIDEKKKTFWKWRLIGYAFNCAMVIAAAMAVYVLIVFLQMPSLDAILKETRLPA